MQKMLSICQYAENQNDMLKCRKCFGYAIMQKSIFKYAVMQPKMAQYADMQKPLRGP